MDITGQGSSTLIENSHLAIVWLESEKSVREKAIFENITEILQLNERSELFHEELMKISRFFCLSMRKKWERVGRNRQRFFQHHKSWLEDKIRLPDHLAFTSDHKNQACLSRPRGRPLKPIEEVSLKTKKRRLADLATNRTPYELQFAAKLASQETAKDDMSSLTAHQALALYLDLDLSEHKYKVLRSVVNAARPNCFPSLYQLKQTKNSLLPSLLTVTETSAEVNLQQLLHRTAQSIINMANFDGCSNQLKLVCKWGFDGSSGHSVYKQKFNDASSTDEFLFLMALVPLRLIDLDTERNAWVNNKPSSTLYCRPIKFMFQKENAELVRNEENQMNDIIKQLQVSDLTAPDGRERKVNYEMLFTMMDGSVTNILSNTNATTRCIICGAAPKEMNTESVLNRPINIQNYRFGLSTLHCWIRFFECLKNIAYRLPVKNWQVRGKEQKSIVENNKKKIQAEFKSKMGLLVDKPKPGYGSTNDGNTARRFFSNPDLSSEITGIDKQLIVKFSVILRVLASGCNIITDKFKMLLDETRQLYINLYGWFHMPNTVHKVLVHGCDIIGAFSMPIGQLSEDALEARHKEVRKNRLSHTRKCSRIASNTDLIRVLLLNSEPLISSKRKLTTKKSIKLDEHVLKYIEQDETSINNIDLDFALGDSSSDSN